MKYGMRKPSWKKSLSARTKGRATRAVKKALIPGYGKKGTGKSRRLIAEANRNHVECGENSVFIDKDGDRMYELNRGIRFINASDFCIDGPKMFTGFVCGIAAQDYDLRAIYINSFMKVVKHSPEGLFGMFDFLREFSEKTNIELYISISSENEAPDYLKAFINQ